MTTSRLSYRVLEKYAQAIWAKQDHSGEPPIPTPETLWESISSPNENEFFGQLHHVFTKLGITLVTYKGPGPVLPPHRWKEITPPGNWKDRSWHFFSLCFYRYTHDNPATAELATLEDSELDEIKNLDDLLKTLKRMLVCSNFFGTVA